MDSESRQKLLAELDSGGPFSTERATGFEEYCDGRVARFEDAPFDRTRSRPWKLGWVEADEELPPVSTQSV
jgi:hypothetical protein